MTASPPAAGANEVTLARLYLIRVVYILFFIPGTIIVWRALFEHEPMARGVFASMISAMFLLSFLVIRHPLKMLPILTLETVRKLMWLAFFGIPQLLSGPMTPQLSEDLLAVGCGPI